jgi:CHASE3 domain sensor protein
MRLHALNKWLGGSARDSVGWAATIPLSIVVVVGTLLSLRSHYLLRHDRVLVVHSFEVMRAADQVLIGGLDAETGQRGFVITGNGDFLVPYEQATLTKIPDALAHIMSLAANNSQQLERINALKELTDTKLAELKLTIDTRKEKGLAASQLLVAERNGKEVMDRIRTVTRGIQDSEEQLLTARLDEVRHDEQRIIVIVILTTILSTLLRIAITAWRRRQPTGNDGRLD